MGWLRVDDVQFNNVRRCSQATTSGYRDNNGIRSDNWEVREPWSELLFVVDNFFFAAIRANKLHGPQTLRVRCETTMFSLYSSHAELDMEIVDDSWMLSGLPFGGVVSPTIDLRGGNDPGNSALTGCGAKVFSGGAKVLLLSFIAVILGGGGRMTSSTNNWLSSLPAMVLGIGVVV